MASKSLGLAQIEGLETNCKYFFSLAIHFNSRFDGENHRLRHRHRHHHRKRRHHHPEKIHHDQSRYQRSVGVEEGDLILESDRKILEEIQCLRPEYIVFTWILCLIALASSLKLYYLVKTALATMIVIIYAVLILVVSKDRFSSRVYKDQEA